MRKRLRHRDIREVIAIGCQVVLNQPAAGDLAIAVYVLTEKLVSAPPVRSEENFSSKEASADSILFFLSFPTMIRLKKHVLKRRIPFPSFALLYFLSHHDFATEISYPPLLLLIAPI